MRRFIFAVLATLFAANAAFAVPKSSTGQNCTSSGVKACTGTENGVKVNCSRCDFCTFNKCEPRDGQIKCFTVTEYSNPTGCTPARALPKGTKNPGGLSPGLNRLQ